MGPIERMKIIMQTTSLPKYHNPKSDRPKGILDLGASKYNLSKYHYLFYRNIHESGTNELLSRIICANGNIIRRFYPSIYHVR